MQTQIMYSLKSALEDRFETEVVIARDGATYPETKPYFVIKQVNNIPVFVAKQRETASIKHYLEVVFFANSYFEMLAYQDELRNYFMFEDLPVIRSDGSPTNQKMVFTVMNEVVLLNNEISNLTDDNQVHFDIMTEDIKHKNRGTK